MSGHSRIFRDSLPLDGWNVRECFKLKQMALVLLAVTFVHHVLATISLKDLDINDVNIKESSVTFSDLLRVTSKDRLDEFNSMELPLLVGYFEEDSPAERRMEKLATALRDSAILILATEDLPQQLGLKENDLIFIPRERNSQVQYEGMLTEPDLRAFLKEREPIIDEIRPSNFQAYINKGIPLIWLMVNPTDGAHTPLIKSLEPVVDEIHDKFSIAWLDASNWAEMAADYGLPVQDLPRIAIEVLPPNESYEAGGQKFWAPAGPVSLKSLKAFLNDYESGKLTADYTPPLKGTRRALIWTFS
eukprot:g8616.t1